MLFPNQTTARLALRHPVPKDLDHVFKGLSDPAVIEHYGIAYRSKDEARAQMDWYEYVWTNEEGLYWVIADKESGAFLGTVGFFNWMHPNRKAELSFWLLPAAWGKGYMQEALAAALRYAFGTMELNRVEALVEHGNTRAERLLLQAGFKKEGTLRECEVKEDADKLISLEMYGLLAREFVPGKV